MTVPCRTATHPSGINPDVQIAIIRRGSTVSTLAVQTGKCDVPFLLSPRADLPAPTFAVGDLLQITIRDVTAVSSEPQGWPVTFTVHGDLGTALTIVI